MVNSVLRLVFSCFLVLKAGQPVSASCPIIMTPSRVVVKYGEPFSVNCSSTTDQRATMGWESSYKGTGSINADDVQLNIEKADKWSIQSECYINLKNSEQCSEVLPIIVYKMPERVSITSPSLNQPLVNGSDYQIKCDVVNVAPAQNLFVTWYIDGINRFVERFIGNIELRPVNQSSVFPIKADKKYHQVKIMCEAKFEFGPTGPFLPPIRSTSAELQVLYAPFHNNTDVETVEIADRKITLNCTVEGNPAPGYKWDVPEPTLHKELNGPVLELTGPFPGSYNCTASNSQGISIKRFNVTDAPRSYAVLAAVVAVPAVLGLLLLISGPFILTEYGAFSCNKGDYMRPSSQPI